MIEALRARGWRLAGRRAAEAGQWDEAVASYARLRMAQLERPADAVRHAAVLEAAGDVDAAAALHEDNVLRHPLSANVYRQAALFMLRQGDEVAAASLFARARVLAGSDQVLEADLHQLGVSPDRARVLALAAFAAGAPPDVRRPSRIARFVGKRLALRARRLRSRQAWAAAADVQTRVVQLTPGNGPAQVRLGHALKESGRIVEAERAYWAGVALAPRDADGYLQLGHALKLHHGRPASLPAYLLAHRFAPAHPDIVRDLGDFGLEDEVVAALSLSLAGGDAAEFIAWAAPGEGGSGVRSDRATGAERRPRLARPLPRLLEARVAAVAGDLARAVGASL